MINPGLSVTVRTHIPAYPLEHRCRKGLQHATNAELMSCEVYGAQWVRDEVRELEWPENHRFAVVWCPDPNSGYSLYFTNERGRKAMLTYGGVLCPLGADCRSEHTLYEIVRPAADQAPERAA
ncbi:hypothetical protein [Rhodococcus aetherivorans]|uniref:hypothetical protein n=1 Tax=Rhodococcus aetherivorans TaxID=191292 RepID=UPI001E550418|nr:hypothetical protein [Rhodococcus aetherivorans]UGQ39386.1 hypothetical protein LRQ66_14310 [Rhodococcus aetherivorans]